MSSLVDTRTVLPKSGSTWPTSNEHIGVRVPKCKEYIAGTYGLDGVIAQKWLDKGSCVSEQWERHLHHDSASSSITPVTAVL